MLPCVDSEPKFCAMPEALTVFFEKNQFVVDAVCDGMAAYEYAVFGVYDALILDVMMPKMDGVEVLRRLRADGVHTPVMMLTAKSRKDDRICGFNAGADDYLLCHRCRDGGAASAGADPQSGD